MDKKKIEELSFEEAMSQLETIVSALEKGDAQLEQSLELFETGTALISRCTGLLDAAEQRVVRLRKSADGTPEELPFEVEE